MVTLGSTLRGSAVHEQIDQVPVSRGHTAFTRAPAICPGKCYLEISNVITTSPLCETDASMELPGSQDPRHPVRWRVCTQTVSRDTIAP